MRPFVFVIALLKPYLSPYLLGHELCLRLPGLALCSG